MQPATAAPNARCIHCHWKEATLAAATELCDAQYLLGCLRCPQFQIQDAAAAVAAVDGLFSFSSSRSHRFLPWAVAAVAAVAAAASAQRVQMELLQQQHRRSASPFALSS